MISYKRGDVVLVIFPNSDQKTYKKRPALVVQNHEVATDFEQLILALITTSPAAYDGPTRIEVEKETRHGRRMSILHDSKIVLDNLATTKTKAIERRLGTCGLMKEVDDALCLTLGLPVPTSV